MSKLDELIKELCPDGVEYKALGEIATDIYRGSGIKRDELSEEGASCVRYGEIYTSYKTWFDTCISHTDINRIKNAKTFTHGDILFAITGENIEDICKSTAYIGNDTCLAGGDIVVLKHNQNPKYLAYVLETENAKKQKQKGRVKSKVVHSNVPSIKSIVVPIVPMPIQEEIVKILDTFSDLSQELSQELSLRQKQYEYYRDYLLSEEILEKLSNGKVENTTLGDLGSVRMCKRILKSQTSSEGEIPFYKIGSFGGQADAYITRVLFEEYKTKYSYPTRGEILISAAGTIGRTVIFDGSDSYFQDSNIVWLAHDESVVLNKYLYYFYQTSPWRAESGGTISRLYNDIIRKTTILLPPLSVQQQIVDILDKFSALCTSITDGLPAEIEARQKQYEYYRDKLLSFETH